MENITYKHFGRLDNELDCYGYAMKVEERLGKHLNDVLTCGKDGLNVIEVNDRYLKGDLIEIEYKKHSHVGVMLDNKLFTHLTQEGERVNRLEQYKVIRHYRII